MDKKISPNRAKKEKIVTELAEKISRSKGLVFTNYQGLSHKQLEVLKKKVKALSSEFIATKNSLLLKAMENVKSKMEDGKWKMENVLKNPTATLFLYGDPVLPLKEIAKALKEFNLPTIKFGILDGKALTSTDLIKISTLPPREILLAQLVGGLKSPILGLHRALNWNIQKFVMTLKAIEKKKQSS